jgi:hypothetical protein
VAATRTFTVDASAPTLTLSGSLYSAPGGWVNQQVSSISASAQDPGQGVTQLELLIDGERAGFGSQTCSAGGCSMSRTFSVDMASYDGGAHTAKLIATDAAGHIADKIWTVNVNPSGAIGSEEAVATMRANLPQLVDASVPTTASDETVAPALQQDGTSLSATQTEAAESVGTSYTSGISVGYPEFSTTLVPTDNPDRTANLVGSNAALYTNTMSSVDTFVRPTAFGSAIVKQIRGPAAPTDFSWRISLATNQRLETLSNGAIAVVQPYPHGATMDWSPLDHSETETANDLQLGNAADAETQMSAAEGQTATAWEQIHDLTVGVIAPIPAKDATGQSVPASLTASGDTVTMHVSPSASAVYPVVAAPQVVSTASLNAYAMCAHAFAGDPEGRDEWCFYDGEYEYEPGDELPDDPAGGPDDIRQWVSPRDIDTLQTLDLAQAEIDAVNAKGDSSGTDLNGYEIGWCFNSHRKPLCESWQKDAEQAAGLAKHEFTGDPTDRSWSNAFKHAVWVGLMIQRHPKHRRGAYHLSILHEGDQIRSDDQGEVRASKMDLINDHTGKKWITETFAAHHNDQDVCLEIKHKSAINGPNHGNPYKHAARFLLYYMRGGDDDGTDIHPNNNHCEGA